MASFINLANKVETVIKDPSADAHPYGFFGFGLTTVLLNISNAGYFPVDSMILAMAIWFGGTCQVMAGIMNYLKGHFLPGFAFAAFGFFWLSYATLLILALTGVIAKPNSISLAWYLAVWGILVIILFIYTVLYAPIFIQVLFASVFVLFFLLAFADGYENSICKKVAGWEGIICGSLAMYAGASHILTWNGKTLLPLGQNYCCSRKKKPSTNESAEAMKGEDEKLKTKTNQ